MQKRKSLLMKILVLLAAVCCTFALAIGMVGCAKEPAKDAAGIKGASINAKGELVLEFTDGKTLTFAGVQGDGLDGCTHDGVLHQLRKANCAENGLALKVCDECDGYAVVETEKDPDVHGTYVTEVYSPDGLVAPDGISGIMVEKFVPYDTTDDVEILTCSGTTYAYGKCAECGKITAGENAATHKHIDPATGESLFEEIEGIHQNGNTCEDGAYVIHKCSYCHVVGNGENGGDAPGYAAARGYHMADATWDWASVPSETTAGLIEGICPDCKAEKTIVIPALSNAEVWTKSVPTCADVLAGEEQKVVYTITDYYGFSSEIKIATDIYHTVVLEGEEYNFEKGETYNYADVKAFIEAGLMDWDGGEPADCNADQNLIVLECKECEKPVVIKAKGPHDLVEVKDAEGKRLVTPATCEEGSYYVLACQCENCDYEEKQYLSEKNAHVYEKVSQRTSGGKLFITLDCKNCAAPVENSVMEIEAELVETIAATCKAPKTLKYKYKLNGEDAFVEVVEGNKVGHKVVLGDKTGYFFNDGVTVYEYADVKAFIEAGLMDWDGGEPADCNADQNVIVYECADCGKPVVIKAKGPHDLVEVKDAEGNRIVTPATCVKGAYYVKECVCEGCDYYEEVFTSEANGHVYEKVSQRTSGGKLFITLDCKNCAAPVENSVMEIEAELVETIAATCKAPKTLKYKYKLNGEDAFVEVVEGNKVGHKVVLGNKTEFFFNDGETVYEYAKVKEFIEAGLMDWDGGEPADCNADQNVIVYECADCGKPVVIKAKGPHDLQDVVGADGEPVVTPATCTEGAYYVKECVCEGCDYEEKVYTSEANGHTWVLDENVTPVENADGTVTLAIKCACGETDTITGREVRHEDVTCDADEITVYEYELEGETKLITIKGELSTGHNPVIPPVEDLTWEIVVGEKTYVCKGKVCDKCGLLIVTERVEKAN